MAHAPLITGDSGCRTAWRVASHDLLPHSRRPVADGPYDRWIAARARGIDRDDAATGARDHSPRRCRFKYRPFREIPSALATASTLPWLSRSADLIISHSIRDSVGSSLS